MHPQLARHVLQFITGLSFKFGKVHRALRLASTGPRARRRCAERHPDEAVATMGLVSSRLPIGCGKRTRWGGMGSETGTAEGRSRRSEALSRARGLTVAP